MTYSKEYIDRAEEVILHTYNRFQIVLDKGNGVHLYDVDGKNIWTLQQESQYLPWDTIIRHTIRR